MSELQFKLRFLVLPDFVYSDNRLNATDIKVYSFINSYKGEKFYFTNEQLAEMFNLSVKTISVSFSRLVDFGYIKTDYQFKGDGGKIRFVVNLRHYDVVKSEITNSLTQKLRTRNDKDNKVKVNKVKETIYTNGHKKYSSLKDITELEIGEIATKYKVPVGFVQLQLEKMSNWCEAKGKSYKNYKMALSNWVLMDMQRTMERGGNKDVRPSIDARGLSKRV